MPLVEINHVDFAYGEQLVLKHIDLPIEEGKTLGLIGPNGGGKTTLIKLLLGLLEPTRGSLRIAGLSPRQAIRRGDLIGYVPQHAQIPSHFPLSVRQAATLGLAGKTGTLRWFARDDQNFVDHLLELTGIAELRDQPISDLSGGQAQRLAIARALAPRPRLLLLDEPTTGIDTVGQQRFIEFLMKLKEELKLTVVFVSHDLRAVSAVADRIACLNVTLHYHDSPQHLPAEEVYRIFACDFEMGKK